MPILNMRLATPRRLIDLNRVGELAYIRAHDGGVAIGAMTRQRAVEKSALVARCVPLLADAMPWVGHFQIRNRGAIGGRLAPRHPAPQLPALAARPVRARDAERRLVGRRPDDAALADAAERVKQVTEPQSDIHATAEYRRHLAGVLTLRALRLAVARARQAPPVTT